MARIARVVIAGYPHHVVQRGVRSMRIFFSAGDREEYLAPRLQGARYSSLPIDILPFGGTMNDVVRTPLPLGGLTINRILLSILGVILLASPIAAALEIEGIMVRPAEARPLTDTTFKVRVKQITAEQFRDNDGNPGDWSVRMIVECFDFSDAEAKALGAQLVHSDKPTDEPQYVNGISESILVPKAEWAAMVTDKRALAALKDRLMAKICAALTRSCAKQKYRFVLRLSD